MKVSTTQEQLAIAKRENLPLFVMGLDDRHIPREGGGSFGQLTFAGPVSAEAAKEIKDFMVAFFKKRKKDL